jgi:hypothetical protein
MMMENLVKAVEARIAEYRAKADAARAAYYQRIEKFCATHNNGVKPTWDAQGRGHAPHDDYVYSWAEGDAIYTESYPAGAYLPFDKELHPSIQTRGVGVSSRFEGNGQRITYVDLDVVDALIEALASDDIEIFHGKVFYSEGEKCHMYVKTKAAGVFDLIEDFIMAPRRAAQEVRKAEQAAIHAAAEPCPAGRVEISGIVLTTKWQESAYGSTLKMLVQDDRGFKVWGSVPSNLYDVKGRSVSFSATIQPSEDDDKFGFFKRPTKAKFNEEEAA